MRELGRETLANGDIEAFYEDDGIFYKRIIATGAEALLKANAEARNSFDKNDSQFKKSEFRRVLSIPAQALDIKAKQLGLDNPQFLDWFNSPEGKKWIKSPECQIFRTVSNDYGI